uniref:Uncharacterized protein n=1 Tax=Setaria viridis TaxID=4556 RepID=A0A4U6UL37_SETVI|nr:hypothetical protein SEVIR_5G331766v2 [Setaria viridis]
MDLTFICFVFFLPPSHLRSLLLPFAPLLQLGPIYLRRYYRPLHQCRRPDPLVGLEVFHPLR